MQDSNNYGPINFTKLSYSKNLKFSLFFNTILMRCVAICIIVHNSVCANIDEIILAIFCFIFEVGTHLLLL